jgi:ubiquinone/menaquinone biosynthesis C-methylase UbiE
VPATRPLVVVDVGGGDGGFARRVVRWARRVRRPVRVLVVERDPATLALARAACAGLREVVLVGGDAVALPLAEGAADVVTASLTLHHLEPDAAAACLAGMAAVARHGAVVNDLLRNRLALTLVWLVTRALRLHAVSRHDGPLSVRRAYSRAELLVLAEKAGLARVAVRRYPLLGRLVAEVA